MSSNSDKNVIMKQQSVMTAKFMARREQNNTMTSQQLREFERNHPQHPDHRAG